MTSGTVVDMTVEKGKIVVAPQREPEFTLEELMKDVTKQNLHAEADWGAPQGREAW